MRVLFVGCGDLGIAAGLRLQRDGAEVFGARRQVGALPAGITPVKADIAAPASLKVLAEVAADVLVYAVAANGRDDAAYQQAYPQGLQYTLEAMGNTVRHVMFVSSTRVYGEDQGGWCDEHGEPCPADFGGERLWQAEQLLQQAACATTALRLSGIYGPGRRRMLALAGKPEEWPADNRWSNRIHRDDAAAFIAYLLAQVAGGKPVQACYNVSDDEPALQYTVLQWLAQRQGLRVKDIVVPPASGGKRVRNTRLHDSGFVLGYPSFREGYGALLDE
ncbi:MAG: SDR family oxidoreductase [Gammaproteobacteria bacterium]|nr:MAG: SDR family oxidoreductase [Gammaproteobacteria bacterium]